MRHLPKNALVVVSIRRHEDGFLAEAKSPWSQAIPDGLDFSFLHRVPTQALMGLSDKMKEAGSIPGIQLAALDSLVKNIKQASALGLRAHGVSVWDLQVRFCLENIKEFKEPPT